VPKQICDFCSSPSVAWRYPAHTFIAYVINGIAGQSVGDWTACRVCHGLIAAGDRCGLLDRSLHTLLNGHPEMRASEGELREQIAKFHRMFFAHQTGAALCLEA